MKLPACRDTPEPGLREVAPCWKYCNQAKTFCQLTAGLHDPYCFGDECLADWVGGAWSSCTDGQQSRLARCVDAATLTGVADALCEEADRPELSQACTPVEAKKDGDCSVSSRGPSTPSGPRSGALLVLLLALLTLFPRKNRE